ncbi:MAG: hypothetical protein PHY05_09360 [Methanothrix sp.]|nr:hypothetical protein [Methanothrix sp.]
MDLVDLGESLQVYWTLVSLETTQLRSALKGYHQYSSRLEAFFNRLSRGLSHVTVMQPAQDLAAILAEKSFQEYSERIASRIRDSIFAGW